MTSEEPKVPPLNPMYYSLDSIALNCGQARLYTPTFERFTVEDCDDVLDWMVWLVKRYSRLKEKLEADRLHAEQPKPV